jgi:hypothetical protein
MLRQVDLSGEARHVPQEGAGKRQSSGNARPIEALAGGRRARSSDEPHANELRQRMGGENVRDTRPGAGDGHRSKAGGLMRRGEGEPK